MKITIKYEDENEAKLAMKAPLLSCCLFDIAVELKRMEDNGEDSFSKAKDSFWEICQSWGIDPLEDNE